MSNFDMRPIPATFDIPFTSRYMEAKVAEDIKILDAINDNYNFGFLTESEALAMIDIVRADEEALVERGLDVSELGDEIPTVNNLFFGEAVLPFKEIIKRREGDSFYEDYTLESTWENDSTVGKMASLVADEKRDELAKYIESAGEDGFDDLTRNLYRAFPDERVSRDYLYEKVICSKALTGAITLEDASVLTGFTQSLFNDDESVGAMAPVIPLTGNVLSKDLSGVSVKDMVSSTDAEINSNEDDLTEDVVREEDRMIPRFNSLESVLGYTGQWFRSNNLFVTTEAAAVFKNNPTFDTEARKLFDKLKKDLKLSNPGDDATSFKSCLNTKKNKYGFSFSNDKADPNMIRKTITSCGFSPVKENGQITHYIKRIKEMLITCEFSSVNTGVDISYEIQGAVKESAIEDKVELGLKSDASDVRDAARKLKKILEKDPEDDPNYDANRDKAENAFDHAIENYKEVKRAKKEEAAKKKEREERKSEKDVLESVKNFRKESIIINEWVNDTYNGTLNENHPYYENSFEEVSDKKLSLMKKAKDCNYNTISESVENRKEELVFMINSVCEEACVDTDNVFDYMVDLINESPSTNLFDSCYNVFESVFDTKLDDIKFTERVNRFATDLVSQNETEKICEKVLNQIDFDKELVVTESDEDEIDEDIKPIVNLLNKLGYTVKYSCSGHNRSRIKEDGYRDGVYHGKIYTTARLTFDKKYKFDTIPEGWYLNKNSDTTGIYVRAYTYNEKDGTPNEAFEKWKKRYMGALKDWVEHLKESKETDEDQKMESAINDFVDSILNPKVEERPVVESTFEDIDVLEVIEREMSELL